MMPIALYGQDTEYHESNSRVSYQSGFQQRDRFGTKAVETLFVPQIFLVY